MVGNWKLFRKLFWVVNRNQFERRVRESGAQKGAKGFSCWSQFVAMMFCQLAQAKSLREISDGLACCEGKLKSSGPPGGSETFDLVLRQRQAPLGALREGLLPSAWASPEPGAKKEAALQE